MAHTLNFDNSHSRIGFTVKHMMFAKVKGSFQEWSGDFTYDPQNPEASKVNVTIQAASIETGNGDRDGHLKSGDFFDVEKFPTLNFKSTKFQKQGNALTIEGELTIRDVTKPVTITAEETGTGVDPWGNKRIGFSGSTSINRKDFGLTWNQALEAGGVLVGENVDIDIEVQTVVAG